MSDALVWSAWASLFTGLASGSFVVAYSILARWWKTYEGRVMMGKAVAISLLGLYAFVAIRVAPQSEALRWASVVLMISVGVFMVAQTRRLIVNQVRRNNRHRKQEVR